MNKSKLARVRASTQIEKCGCNVNSSKKKLIDIYKDMYEQAKYGIFLSFWLLFLCIISNRLKKARCTCNTTPINQCIC